MLRHKVKFVGFKAGSERFRKLVEKGVFVNLEKACQFVVEEAKRRAPEHLKDLIDYEVMLEGGRVVGYVGVRQGPKSFTALWFELGTSSHGVKVGKKARVLRDPETGDVFGREVTVSGIAAQPYLRPSVFNNRKRITEIIQGEE